MELPYTSVIFWFLPMLLAVISELGADFLGKKWTLDKKQILFSLSILFYIAANAFWMYSVVTGVGLGRGAVVFSIGQQIAAISLGIIYFKEKLSRKQLFGAMLGLITIVIMGVA